MTLFVSGMRILLIFLGVNLIRTNTILFLFLLVCADTGYGVDLLVF